MMFTRFATNTLLLGALALVVAGGCASTPEIPPDDGEPIGPGMRSFDRVREMANHDRTSTWSPNAFTPNLPVRAPEAVSPRADTPVEISGEAKKRRVAFERGPVQAGASVLFRFYQNTYSRADGSTCRFHPTCSGFGRQAVARHGVLGVVLTFGRLSRNHTDEDFFPADGQRLLDPVHNYTFTLNSPKIDDFQAYDDDAHAWYMHVEATETLWAE